MRLFRIVIRLCFLIIIGAFLHYTLPQRDIVQITSTEVIRTELTSTNSMFFSGDTTPNADGTSTRDLRLINTRYPQGPLLGIIPRSDMAVSVYRNEDAGLWPPYFKYDSSDLQAEADSAAKSEGWYIVKHYGWRNNFLSIYPNATSMTPIDGPHVRIIPWFNILILIGLFVAFLFVRNRWNRFYEHKIEPIILSMEDRTDRIRSKFIRR